MTVLVMDGRLQDAAERLGMAMCGEGLKVAALRLCEALLFQEPRSATPTGALVRDVCSMIARCTPAVAERRCESPGSMSATATGCHSLCRRISPKRHERAISRVLPCR